jgi:hypothetical protein
LIGRDHCEQLTFLDSPSTPFAINYTNGDSIQGSYELFLDNRSDSFTADNYGSDPNSDPPVLEPAIYSAQIEVHYTDDQNSLRGNRTATPDRRRDIGGGEPFSIAVAESLTYKDGGRLRTIEKSGTITTFQGGVGSLSAIGPASLDVDSDSNVDFPLIAPGGAGNPSDVKRTEVGGAIESFSNGDATTDDSVLAASSWLSGPPSVVYAQEVGGGPNSDAVVRIWEDGTGTVQQDVIYDAGSDGVRGIAGAADVTGDGTKDMVFIARNDEIQYYDGAAGTVSTAGTGPINSYSTSPPVGQPGDFDKDGTARIPFVDGAHQIALMQAGGGENAITGPVAVRSPLATIDWDGDSELEIGFVEDGTNELHYVDDVGNTNTINRILDTNGDPVVVDPDPGVR